MPNLTIYVNAELYEIIKSNPSKIIQKALNEMIEKKTHTKAKSQ